jgi:hypothetical protein
MKNLSLSQSNFSGIYIIINQQTNKIYIGSSNNIYYRLRRHISDLLKNQHGNQHLQNSFNIYGINNFTTNILEKVNEDQLIERECYYIDKYKPEYNKLTPQKVYVTDEMKKKISETLKRKYKSGEISTYHQDHRMRKIEYYNNEGILITSFNCMRDCSNYFHFSRNTVSEFFRKKNNHKHFLSNNRANKNLTGYLIRI